ncbi:hypothetical protein N7G274_010767 [Stereocaulon virgatum]|uniref:Uncharacterized protein n=1 Tax=Stereocaulon virgatum TaxID=373712 RepID=A0ABR3ZV63_9LECA
MNSFEQGAEQAMGGNMEQDALKDMSGGGGNQQGGGSGGGGVDGAINSAVDEFASKEGVPSAADGMINKEVDSEVNKFT